jgi:two-component system LytT family response regulator
VDQIDWIESAANYASVHVGKSSYTVRTTMGELEKRLDPQAFARIHRSLIVNINRIAEINRGWHGDLDVLLQDGRTLRMSRSYRGRLLT